MNKTGVFKPILGIPINEEDRWRGEQNAPICAIINQWDKAPLIDISFMIDWHKIISLHY